MTSSWSHRTKLWGLFFQKIKVQSNIYRMVGWNKLQVEWCSSYSHLKCLILVVERERDSRESGTVTFHVSLFKCPGWKFVGKVHSSWNFDRVLLGYCWMMLWVDECSNEDPGPLTGPRFMYIHAISYAIYAINYVCFIIGGRWSAQWDSSRRTNTDPANPQFSGSMLACWSPNSFK